MAALNETIHQPVRLRIMASLVTLEPGNEVDFTYLRDLLEVTDGNLGAHLRKLEEAGYVEVEKSFKGRRPNTNLRVTREGRDAFRDYARTMKQVLQDLSVS